MIFGFSYLACSHLAHMLASPECSERCDITAVMFLAELLLMFSIRKEIMGSVTIMCEPKS